MPAFASTEERFELGATRARELAQAFGTPLYVLDEAAFRSRIRRYRAALSASWPNTAVSFASKANSTLAVLRIAFQEGCTVDVASEGELRAALAAGVPAEAAHFHGNNKQESELEFALSVGVGQIIVDNFPEIECIARLAKNHPCPEILVRCAPGVDPITHERISTGQADTKFGFNIEDGGAERAVLRVRELNLPYKGLHCHVGSQLLDPGAQIAAAETLAAFACALYEDHGFETEIVNIGGGLGVRYMDSDEPFSVERYCEAVSKAFGEILANSGLEPKLVHEPGRSLVAEAGVTLYTVGVAKTATISPVAKRTYVVVDGGLSDNPRPAMYNAKYTVRHLPAPGRGSSGVVVPVRIAGKHCETDILFDDVPLPTSVERGDLLQVLCTGAYNSGMASNYNRYPRPASVLIRESGEVVLVQRRENWEDVFSRDVLPENI